MNPESLIHADGRVVAAIDASAYTGSVCRHAAWAAGRLGAPLSMVHVIDPADRVAPLDLAGNLILGERELGDAARVLDGAGLHATTEVIDGHPEEALAAYVDRQRIDLLVMGAYGHSRIRQLIVGSTTTAVMHSCQVPVLLLR